MCSIYVFIIIGPIEEEEEEEGNEEEEEEENENKHYNKPRIEGCPESKNWQYLF